MLPDQRRAKILDFAERNGFASLQQLVEATEASESTIRRDLEVLDRSGHIRRTRGGIAYSGESLTTFEDRTTRALPQKQRIGRAIAEMVQPGESILLDGGTTTFEVARHLMNTPLQIVTNSLPIAQLLINAPNIELILIGGYLYPKTGVALGPIAVDALSTIRVQRLIMSVGGITEEGMFNSNTLLVEAEQRMLETAEEVIVAVDSGKFGRNALAKVCDLNRPDRIIVDNGINDHWRNVMSTAGVGLTIVE
ncbi:DeoR/GlpR family DNA-binding transcription regulator [Rubinisphaera italica]|uniref:Glycerol-3-phosphate regulon repressor n=1 Tax=Rubinisphaera italica TaxID=2527969 RepID=A0A5C5XQA7_9PLAN|nr:DeoR/GlpR family DNA-binding transcription regulator [Rubinisphaera italica]TWT63952.1 Glycerol-3-phosphate regulon repressor [Rubinisphaera italica]